MLKNTFNKAAMTLTEMLIVVGIIIILIIGLANSLGGVTSKSKDTSRIKILDEYLMYYSNIKDSLGQYPGPNMKGSGAAKDAAKDGWTNDTEFIFDDVDDDGYYLNAETKRLQEALVETKFIESPGSIKRGLADESIMIFTSTTQKRAVGCVKLFAPNDAADQDGDGIPNDNDVDSGSDHENGNRIYVKGDMGLWNQNKAAYTAACQGLTDPASL